MYFRRATDRDAKHVCFKESLNHNTTLIALLDKSIAGVLEHRIDSFRRARIIHFKTWCAADAEVILSGLIEEMLYWNPYLRYVEAHVWSDETINMYR